MITKEHTILEPFIQEPWKKFTFNEVKKLSHNKSDNYVHTTLKRLVKAGILKEEKVGNNVIYSVADNIFALNTLGFFAEHKAHDTSHLPHKSIQKIAAKIRSPFYSLLITGSYAKAKQKATSDVDLVILCESKSSSAAILSQIKLESELAIPEIHLQIFTWEDFYIMLTNNEENFGKEVARNNLIITGGKPYYAVLLEAIKHGFAG